MTDQCFHKLAALVASRIKGSNAQQVLDEHRDWYLKILPHVDRDKVVIKSSVWGWSIECPTCYSGDYSLVSPQKFTHGHWVQILAEGLLSLNDAATVCDTLGLKFTVLDTQDPDPL